MFDKLPLCMALALLLVACGGSPSTSTPTRVPDPDPEPPADTDVPIDADGDGDGYAADVDCDDSDPRVYPGAVPPPGGLHPSPYSAWSDRCRDFDRDCDGVFEGQEDFDGDGFSWCDHDCDDQSPELYPGAPDPIDGVDQNCDGTDGVGESPTQLEVGTLFHNALGANLLTADVNGDGCDDLVLTQSGIGVPHLNYGSTPGEIPLVHAWIGCTTPTAVHTFDALGLDSLGRRMVRWPTEGGDVVVAVADPWEREVALVDFGSDPAVRLGGLRSGPSQDILDVIVLQREQTELIATEDWGPARAWTLPLSPSYPPYDEPDREWWADPSRAVITSLAYDRDGDGLDELITSGPSTQVGEVYVLFKPGLESAAEVWTGDVGDLFGEQLFAAPDLPSRGDRSIFASSAGVLNTGALYLLPSLGPGEYTLNDSPILFMGEYEDERFGISAAVGDVTGDGVVDVVVGASQSVWDTDPQIGKPGKVYVFPGPIVGPVLSRKDARVFVGAESSEYFGFDVQLADLNGDGLLEIYVGAPGHTDPSWGPGNQPDNGALYRIDLD